MRNNESNHIRILEVKKKPKMAASETCSWELTLMHDKKSKQTYFEP